MKAKIDPASFGALTKKIKKLEYYSKQGIAQDIYAIGLDAALKSKMDAPVDTGNLRRLISAQKHSKGVEIFSKANYSPYMEFGTGRYVDIGDLKDLGFPASYAKQFKGKGLKKVNIQPRPFFFGSIDRALTEGILKIKNKIKQLT